MRLMRHALPIVAAGVASMSCALAGDAPKARDEAGGAGPSLTEDECRAIWNTAAGRSDLSVDGAKPYVDSFEAVDANRDKKISNAEFKAGCKAGLVHKFRKSD